MDRGCWAVQSLSVRATVPTISLLSSRQESLRYGSEAPCLGRSHRERRGLRRAQTFIKFRPAEKSWRKRIAMKGPVCMDVPDFLPATWTKARDKPPGPSFEYNAEDAIQRQLDALQVNDWPYADHGVEVMYRFAGFDPFERSSYFGPLFDLGQFERFRRIYHHSSYRVLLGHKDRKILSSFQVNEHSLKQRIGVVGARPGEEEIFEFTIVQRVGGSWDGYWLTESVIHDGDGLRRGIAY